MKLNDDIYVIDFETSFTFNIHCLVDYKDLINIIPLVDEPSHEPIFKSSFLSSLRDTLPYSACQVDKLLDDKIITT